jgi:hypothetical protein
VASREKHYGSSSTEVEDSDENYSSDEDEATGQQSSNSKAKGGTEDDEGVSATGTGARKNNGTSSKDSEDSEVSQDDATSSSTKPGSSKSTLKDTEEDSNDSDATDSKNSGTQESNGVLADAEDEESVSEDALPTSSRMKTVHSKPTSTPVFTDNINAATPTLSLPSTPSSSAQPVGCAGGINATSSYCSAPSSTNHAAYASKLDSKAFFVAILVCSFGLI